MAQGALEDQASPSQTRTEAFLQWAHDNSAALAEVQRETERRYDEEAEAAFAALRKRKGAATESELKGWHEQLDAAEQLLAEVPF